MRDGRVDTEREGLSRTDRRTELVVLGHRRDLVRARLRRGRVLVADLLAALGRKGRGRERSQVGVPRDGAGPRGEVHRDTVVVLPVDLQVVELAELHPGRLLRGLGRLAHVAGGLVARDVGALVVLRRGRRAESRGLAVDADLDVGPELALHLLVVLRLDRDLARAFGLSLEHRAGLDPGAVALEDGDRVVHRRPGLAGLRLDGSECGTGLGDLLGLLGHPHEVVDDVDLALDAQSLGGRVVEASLVATRLLAQDAGAVLAEDPVVGLDLPVVELALAGDGVHDLVPEPRAHRLGDTGSRLDLVAGHGLRLDVEVDIALVRGLELGRGRNVVGGLERGLAVGGLGHDGLRGVRREGRETGHHCQHGKCCDDAIDETHCCSPFR